MSKKEWEGYPSLDHLADDPAGQKLMRARRRHRQVRYLLFRLQTQASKGEGYGGVDFPPGFVEFWLAERPRYSVDHRDKLGSVPINKDLLIGNLGGYLSFASVWDIDEELFPYLRHRSVWHVWHTKLMAIVPVLGEG